MVPPARALGRLRFIQAEVVVLDPDFNVIAYDPYAQCAGVIVPPFGPPGTYHVRVAGSEDQGCFGCTFDYTIAVSAL